MRDLFRNKFFETILFDLVNKANGLQFFLVYLFLFFYVLRATICPSSGETTVSIRHSRPKHVKKRNKRTKKNFAPS